MRKNLNLKVLHTIPSLSLSQGGQPQVVVNLTDALSENLYASVQLLSQADHRSGIIVKSQSSQVLHLMECSENPLSIAFGIPIYKKLNEQAKLSLPDLIHSHGLWHLGNHWSARFAAKNRIPYTLHPHGMLEPWALNYRPFKKQIALNLYQRCDLEQAQVLFATAPQEAQSIRQFGLPQPIAITPNGIPFPKFEQKSTPRNPSTPRTALFLSRIHPKKGLINLIQAWHQISPTGWQLLIAGPDENNHLAQVQAQIKALNLDSAIKTVGPVEGETKANLYRQAGLFILPTFSENFGVVIAEALSYGIPVITTTGAPWSALKDYQCGWWVKPTVEQIADALKEAISLDSLELQAMGARGREYVKRYDWKLIAQDTLAVYRWILNQGPKPDCVILD